MAAHCDVSGHQSVNMWRLSAINTHTFILKDIIVRFGQTQQVSTKLDISIVGTRHSSLASPLHSRSLLSRSHTCRDTCEQALACVMIFFSFFAVCVVVYQNKETSFV